MNDYERALALRDETVAHRRWMHTHAEVGLETPKAQAYVIEQLAALRPRRCGGAGEEGRQDAAAARGYGRAADEGGERRALRLSDRHRGARLRP